MLGTPTHKEMERQMIGLERDKFQYEGLGGRGGTVQAMGRPRFCLVDQIREGILVKKMLTSRRTRRSSPSRPGG